MNQIDDSTLPLVLATPRDSWLQNRNRETDLWLRAHAVARMPNLRHFPWQVHDLLLARYLAAMEIADRPMMVFTGDSTIAQTNARVEETIANLVGQVTSLTKPMPPVVLNIAVDGTAEGYLFASIRAALAIECKIVAGITVRDLTHLSNTLFSDEETSTRFLSPTYYLNEFTRPNRQLSERALSAKRKAVLNNFAHMTVSELQAPSTIYKSMAPTNPRELLTPEHWDEFSAIHSANTQSSSVPSGLYADPEEMTSRIDRKNALLSTILNANPLIHRLEHVMKSFAHERHRIVWAVMPMNDDLDVKRFGLNPEIPLGLYERVRAMAARYGYATVGDGALWPGRFFEPDDVVHLNANGSQRLARLIFEGGHVPNIDHVDCLPSIEGAFSRYRSSMAEQDRQRGVEVEGARARVVSGLQRPYASWRLDRGATIKLQTTVHRPAEAPSLQLFDEQGRLSFDAKIETSTEIAVSAHADKTSVQIGADLRNIPDAITDCSLGYLDTSGADREFAVIVVCTTGPVAPSAAVVRKHNISTVAPVSSQTLDQPARDDPHQWQARLVTEGQATQEQCVQINSDTGGVRLVALGESRGAVSGDVPSRVRLSVHVDHIGGSPAPSMRFEASPSSVPSASIALLASQIITVTNLDGRIDITSSDGQSLLTSNGEAVQIGYFDESTADRETVIRTTREQL